MANDREVLREIWEGKIPVCFQLNAEEVSDLQAPDPFYLMVPRLSYFPLCTDKVSDINFHYVKIYYIIIYFYKFHIETFIILFSG